MQIYSLYFVTLIVLACIASAPVLSQRNLRQQAPQYCVTPNNRYGSCVALPYCPEISNLLRTFNQRQAQQYIIQAQRTCGSRKVNGSPEVCCSNPRNVPQISARRQRKSQRRAMKAQPNPFSSFQRLDSDSFERSAGPVIRNNNKAPRRLPTIEEGCGYNRKSFKKIVGGEVSQRGSWPWIALIGYDDILSGNPFKCGGALITARHVITAAHCIRNDLKYVRLGEHDLSTDSEVRHMDIRVVRAERHPKFSANGRRDIAILYLERNVEFTDYIAPICLPTTPELRQKSYIKYSPFVAGWGKTMEGGVSANVLQELQIPIYDNSICRDRYKRENSIFTDNQFDAGIICAGVLSGGKDTCQGDSGGPLMLPERYQDSVRFYLIGVVSFGIGCARPQIPGIYSSTQYYIDWIIQKVAETP